MITFRVTTIERGILGLKILKVETREVALGGGEVKQRVANLKKRMRAGVEIVDTMLEMTKIGEELELKQLSDTVGRRMQIFDEKKVDARVGGVVRFLGIVGDAIVNIEPVKEL